MRLDWRKEDKAGVACMLFLETWVLFAVEREPSKVLHKQEYHCELCYLFSGNRVNISCTEVEKLHKVLLQNSRLWKSQQSSGKCSPKCCEADHHNHSDRAFWARHGVRCLRNISTSLKCHKGLLELGSCNSNSSYLSHPIIEHAGN